MRPLTTSRSASRSLRWALVALAGAATAAGAAPRAPGVVFRHLTVADGLSDARARSVIQDRHGYVWIGTADGLNRYDGYRFRVFRHDPEDDTTLGPGFLSKIAEDQQGRLWIGLQGGGLSRYDPESETFTHFRNDPVNPRTLSDDLVTALVFDAQGTLWVGTAGGLNRVDPRTGEVTRYRHDPSDPNSLTHDEVAVVRPDRSGAIWVGTEGGGLDRLRPSDSEGRARFEHFRHDPDNPRSLSSDRVQSILQSSSGTLWVGTWDAGLNRLAPDGAFVHYGEAGRRGRDRGDRIYDLLEDDRGAIWIALWAGGVGRLDPATGAFERFLPDLADPASLSHANATALCKDRGGLLWIATVGGGLNIVDLEAKPFVRYPVTGRRPGGLSAKDVRAVIVDGRGDVWAGTFGDGLNHIQRGRARVARFRHDPADPHSLADDTVRALVEDRDGAIWIGTFGGLDRFDSATGRFVHHREGGPGGLSSDKVQALHEDASGRLWVGTFEGLDLLDRATGQFRTFRRSGPGRQSVTFITGDPSGALWLGVGQELLRFEPETGQFEAIASDPLHPGRLGVGYLWSMSRDRAGRLWIGSSQGLLELLPSGGSRARLRAFGSGQGLPDALVASILTTDGDELWLGTTRGLVRFDPRRGVARRYDTWDGLPDESFNPNSGAFRAADGEMLFGATGGLTSFRPDEIKDDPIAPRVALTALRLSHRPVPIGPGSVLTRALSFTEAITVPHDVRILDLDFANLNFRAPQRNRFRYRLEGFDEGWHQTAAGEHSATYTNLSPGRYVFRVLGSNGDGVWAQNGAAVAIQIRPPWWGTWWLRSLAILSAAGLLFAAHRFRTSAIEARSAQILREMRDREDAQRALTRSERQLRLIADAVPFVIAYVDVMGRVRFVNQAAEQWAGQSRSELEGREVAEILPAPVFAVLRERLEMAQGGERVAFDFAVGAQPATRRRIAATLVPHADGDGMLLGFYAFAEDVTDRVRTQEELHRQQDLIAHASRISTLGEMATALAHELNQPLTAVLSNANAVLRLYAPPRAPLPEEVDETLHDIADDATRAGEIIRRLRDLVRRTDSRKTPLDVNQAIRGVEALVRAVALECDVAVFIDLVPGPAMCVGDAIQVQQVILNLVRNAIDAMRILPKPERRLVVRSLRDGGAIVVLVEDSGPPLEDKALDQLFTPFYTTKAQGLGMGLAISRSIIEAHGGVIEAHSRSGRGLAVRFTLRAKEAGDAVGPRMSA